MSPSKNTTSMLVGTAVLILWLYGPSGVVAYYGDVWTKSDVLARMSAEAKQVVTENETVKVVGFSEEKSIHLLFLAHLSMLALLLSYRHVLTTACLGRYLSLSVFLFLMFQWPHWARNTILSDAGRRVFSLYNADIHFPSFVVQELRIFSFMSVIAVAMVTAGRVQVAAANGESVESKFFDSVATVSHQLSLWHLRSVLLMCVFLPITYLYYRNITQVQDFRYLPSAIMMHLFWLLVWYTVTQPLITSWTQFRRQKRDYLESSLAHPADIIEARVAVLANAGPSSDLNILGAAIIAGAAFVSPLVGPFLK